MVWTKGGRGVRGPRLGQLLVVQDVVVVEVHVGGILGLLGEICECRAKFPDRSRRL